VGDHAERHAALGERPHCVCAARFPPCTARPRSAPRAATAAPRFKPHYVEAYNNLASTLLDLHRPDAALAAYDKKAAFARFFGEISQVLGCRPDGRWSMVPGPGPSRQRASALVELCLRFTIRPIATMFSECNASTVFLCFRMASSGTPRAAGHPIACSWPTQPPVRGEKNALLCSTICG
jgi:hypothetical protein